MARRISADADYRTREQRSLEWEKDFIRWGADLSGHQDSEHAVVQLELLELLCDGLIDYPEETIDFMHQLREELDRSTVKGDAAARLVLAVLWYVEPAT